MKYEQEKQETRRKTDRKQITDRRTEKTRTIVCRTMEEAKQKILELLNQEETYRDVSQIVFIIAGRKRRFSISQIANFVKERDMAMPEREEGDIARKVFSLFERGMSPVQVVIELKLPPGTVDELYTQYIKLSGLDADPTKLNHLIRQFVPIRDRVLCPGLEALTCPYCGETLEYVETFDVQGCGCSNCGRFIEYGELMPKSIPENISVS